MKFRKLVMCGILVATTAMMPVPTAVSVSAAEAVTGEADAYESDVTDSQSAEENLQETTNESENTEETAEITGAIETTENASEWTNRILVVVEENSSLNVRNGASTDTEVIGRLKRGDGADIVEKGEEWTKIVSGEVEGYVKNEYCLFESEAEAQAEEICGVKATVKTDGLRIRSEASEESAILDVLDEGDSMSVVVTETDADDVQADDAADETAVAADESIAETESEEDAETEWIQVEYNGTTAYVSADYVDVALNVGEAQSVEAIYEEQAASGSQDGTTSASADDVALLAALIQCEAGGESYEGQMAVGAVVMNRVKSASFPNSVSGVIYQSGQFTPASSGKLSRVLSSGSGSISSSCYQAANEAIGGADNTGGALYFHAGSGNGRVIGNQVFY